MDQPDIPKGRHKNKPAFETTHFCEQIVLSSYSHSQLGVLPNRVFLLVLVKYNMLLETASWKHKLQSHVPLLYSSGTCNLSAKISKLATPNSPKGAQAGIGTRALLGSSHLSTQQLQWVTSSHGLQQAHGYGNVPPSTVQ